jgi:hypothetical protein
VSAQVITLNANKAGGTAMTEPAWLLLTFGPLLWMALLAAFFGSGEKSDPTWVRTLVLYAKAQCINLGAVALVWWLQVPTS